MNIKTKYSALALTTLLIVAIAGPAKASTQERPAQAKAAVSTPASVQASPAVVVTFEKPSVTTAPAPVPEPQYVAPMVQPPVQALPAPVAPVVPQISQPAPPPQPVLVQASRGNSAILASAYEQLGQIQDCTRMVERALGSIGIVTGDIAPQHFFRFGSVVSDPQPGDIVISAGHVGIYSGNGMMISGGFNGNQTVEHPVRYVGAASYVRVA